MRAKILTLTLNPAVDRTLYFDNFRAGEANTAVEVFVNWGGKGVNVARALAFMSKDEKCADVSAAVLLGRDGTELQRVLEREGIGALITYGKCNIRQNSKLITYSGSYTEANEVGGPVGIHELRDLTLRIEQFWNDGQVVWSDGRDNESDVSDKSDKSDKSEDAESSESSDKAEKFDKFEKYGIFGKSEKNVASDEATVYPPDNGRFFIIGGSLPQGVKKDVYSDVIRLLKNRNINIVCDTSGPALFHALKEGLFMIKPNLAELGQFVGKKISTIPQAVEESVNIYEEYGTRVVCTAGEKGSIYVGPEGVYTCDVPQVRGRGFAGAGDTYLAAFVYSMCRQDIGVDTVPLRYSDSGVKLFDIPRAMRAAASAAASKVELEGTALPDASEEYYKYVNIINVERLA